MKNIDKSKQRQIKLWTLGILLLLVSVGTTYAWWSAAVETKQTVTMGNLKITADFPELLDSSGYEPGTSVEIEGTIKNKGTIPAIMKIDNTSQIKFSYLDDQLTPVVNPVFEAVDPTAVQVSFAPKNGQYEGTDDVHWFKDNQEQLYILMEPQANLAVTVQAAFSGENMTNKYMDAEIEVGAKVKATQVIEGAMLSELGVDASELSSVSNETTRRTLSTGQKRLTELLARTDR